jgi:glutamine synthetase
MITDKARKLFEENNIYTHSELEARHEIELEKYIKKVQIEGRMMAEIASSHILPAAVRYQNTLIQNVKGLKEVGLAEEACQQRTNMLKTISEHINQLSTSVENMINARKKCNAISESREKAISYCTEVKEKYFDEIRYHADKLELLVDDKEWNLPKYRELLFLR